MRRRCLAVAALLGVVCCAVGARAAEPKVALELAPDAPAVPRGGALGIEAVATIARGWHINASKPNQPFLVPTVLTLAMPPGVTADAITYPRPDKKTFAFAGGSELLVYEGKLGMTTALRVPADFQGDRLAVTAALRYQACDDTTCLPPATATATLELQVGEAAAAAPAGGGVTAGGGEPDGGELVRRTLAEQGLLVTLLAVALLGLGLNLTPCVYPLISVTIAYFGGQARTRARVTQLALLYVVGIALSFSAVGLAAALSGGLFGAALQKPPVVLFIAAVMVVLALGSFGLYQFQPPAALMRRAGASGSGAAGALFMGLTMGVVAAPCVGPIVVGLLIFVSSRQDPWLGFLLFFVLALGMGAPYLGLAMAAGSIKRLPRSGEWLLWTERLFGCILLCLAAYFVSPLLPPLPKHWLLPAAIGASGIYLGFLERAGRTVPYFALVKTGVGVAMLAVAVWLAPPAQSGRAIAWESLAQWSQSKEDGRRPVLLDFAAEWCIPCRKMDHTTYVDPAVVREADRFRMVKADITNETDETEQVVNEYDVKGVPTVILISPVGEETHRMVGYVGPDELLQAMRRVQ
jgi:thioredoxin:protein disulfide reductase